PLTTHEDAMTTGIADGRIHVARKASRSLVKRLLAVAKRPCGSSSYSMRLLPVILFASARPAASMGTILSAVPWMIRVGTSNAFKSFRKSVRENDSTQASVDLNPASRAMPVHAASSSSLTGRDTKPVPKNCKKKFAGRNERDRIECLS